MFAYPEQNFQPFWLWMEAAQRLVCCVKRLLMCLQHICSKKKTTCPPSPKGRYGSPARVLIQVMYDSSAWSGCSWALCSGRKREKKRLRHKLACWREQPRRWTGGREAERRWKFIRGETVVRVSTSQTLRDQSRSLWWDFAGGNQQVKGNFIFWKSAKKNKKYIYIHLLVFKHRSLILVSSSSSSSACVCSWKCESEFWLFFTPIGVMMLRK